VGRKKELRRLRNAFHRARKEQRCVVATIVGEAGIGKTRLGRALVTSVRDDARVLVGRCVAYGAGATFLPVAEIVKRAAPEASVEGIAALLSGEEDGAQVAQRVAELVGIAEGPAAPGESLPAEDVGSLLEQLAGGPVAPDVQAKITERAGGNALFAQQLLALAAEAPDVSLDEAPPTVEALIASRLDRLDPGERDVLQRASVIGRHFTRAHVKDLGPLNDTDLVSLERRALVH